MVRDVGVNTDRVDDPTLDERLQRPDQVGQVDAVHRRAVADILLQEADLLLGELLAESAHQVEFGADHPFGACGCGGDGLDDLLGGSDLVGELDDLVSALRVDDHLDARDIPAGRLDRLHREAPVHRAVPAPQDHRRCVELLGGQPAHRLVRVPDDTVLQRSSEVTGIGVAAKVLVGQEEHLASVTGLVQRPGQRGPGVGGRADGAPVAAGEGLDRGGGVHVGHGHDPVGDPGLDQVVPAVLDLVDRGHVGH